MYLDSQIQWTKATSLLKEEKKNWRKKDLFVGDGALITTPNKKHPQQF